MSGPSVVGPVRVEITRDQIRRYADVSGDHNPLHLDDQAGKAAGFGGIIAHGMLTMAIVGRVLTEWCGTTSRVNSFRVRFSRVVRPGDVLTITGRVVEGEGKYDATVELSAVNQSGEDAITAGRATIKRGE